MVCTALAAPLVNSPAAASIQNTLDIFDGESQLQLCRLQLHIMWSVLSPSHEYPHRVFSEFMLLLEQCEGHKPTMAQLLRLNMM